MTAAWNDGLNVRVDGYRGNALAYSQTIVMNDDGPIFFRFDYDDVTNVTFTSFGGVDQPTDGSGTHIAFDNMWLVS
jgi:hypothetical protein